MFVVNDGVWHCEQPILLNVARPFLIDVAPPGMVSDGVGGARNRMKNANLVGPLMASAGSVASVSVVSFGTVANWQVGSSSRSWMKSSLEIPCSTLYASPAKMRSDLFCAFQPNRVIVPSLPEWLGSPVSASTWLSR